MPVAVMERPFTPTRPYVVGESVPASLLIKNLSGVSVQTPVGVVVDRPHEEPRFFDTLPPSYINHVFSPTNTLVHGRRNAGKTYFLTLHSIATRRRLDMYGWKFVKIASNYYNSVAYRDGLCSQFILDEITKFPPWGMNMALYVDEIQGKALARRSMSAGAVNLSSFLTMTRKRDIDLVSSTQFPQVLDQQVLHQVDFTVEIATSFDKRFARLWVTDFWGQFNGEPRRLKMPPYRWEADFTVTIAIPRPKRVFESYHHKQVMVPSYLDERTREAISSFEDERWGSAQVLPGQDVNVPPQMAALAALGRVGRPEDSSDANYPAQDTAIEASTWEERQAEYMASLNEGDDPLKQNGAKRFQLSAGAHAWGMTTGDAYEHFKKFGCTFDDTGKKDGVWVIRPPKGL